MIPADRHTAKAQGEKLSSYYRIHAGIYDWTRWAFLFGRASLLDLLPELPPEPRILEVGCGTGRVLQRLVYRYPDGKLRGVDLSEEMLDRASRRFGDDGPVSFLKGQYGVDNLLLPPFDLIICSYSLTMAGEHVEEVLERIQADLKPKGILAVVDFHSTPLSLFRRWMARNHVRVNGHLPPLLNKYFRPLTSRRHRAYLGAWSWFHFVGRRS